jgi:hypothetical protein
MRMGSGRYFGDPYCRCVRCACSFSSKNCCTGVTGKYSIEGPDRYKVMTLATHEFIRHFLIHVLPAGFHRIRYD